LNEICGSCGAETKRDPAALVNDCATCGARVLGPVTPPTEDLGNICRVCRHPVRAQHDDFGCHAEGCFCVETGAGMIDNIQGCLPNAAGEDAAQKWSAATPEQRVNWAKQAGVGDTPDRIKDLPEPHRSKLEAIVKGEKTNAASAADLAHVLSGACAKCKAAYDKQSMNPADYCPIGAKAFENQNADDRASKEKKIADLEKYLEGMRQSVKGYKTSEVYQHVEASIATLKSELANAAPDFKSAIAAFEAHCKSCAKCGPVRNAPAGSDQADAKNLCATGAQLLVADLQNASDGWKKGTLEHGGKRYSYEAKVYEEGSEYGINGGRVSKLHVKAADGDWSKSVIEYDRGWSIQPSSEHRPLLDKLLQLYNAADPDDAYQGEEALSRLRALPAGTTDRKALEACVPATHKTRFLGGVSSKEDAIAKIEALVQAAKAGLQNGNPHDDRAKEDAGRLWDQAPDAQRRKIVEELGLGIGIIQFRWSQMPDSAKQKLLTEFFGLENANDPKRDTYKCRSCGFTTQDMPAASKHEDEQKTSECRMETIKGTARTQKEAEERGNSWVSRDVDAAVGASRYGSRA